MHSRRSLAVFFVVVLCGIGAVAVPRAPTQGQQGGPRRQPPRSAGCTEEALEEQDQAAIERAASAPRRPRGRVSLFPFRQEPSSEPNMEAIQAQLASDQRLFAELERFSRRMSSCYGRVLAETPTVTGAVPVEIVTREGRGLEAQVNTAFGVNPALSACVEAAYAGARTRGEFATDTHEAVYLFCPADRKVCIGSPIDASGTGREALHPAEIDSLAATLQSRMPAVEARYRALGAGAPRGMVRVNVRVTPNGRLGALGFGEQAGGSLDSDSVFDVLDPLTGLCAPPASHVRSFVLPMWLGVR